MPIGLNKGIVKRMTVTIPIQNFENWNNKIFDIFYLNVCLGETFDQFKSSPAYLGLYN